MHPHEAVAVWRVGSLMSACIGLVTDRDTRERAHPRAYAGSHWHAQAHIERACLTSASEGRRALGAGDGLHGWDSSRRADV